MKSTFLNFQPLQALSIKTVETLDLQGNPKYAKVLSENTDIMFPVKSVK